MPVDGYKQTDMVAYIVRNKKVSAHDTTRASPITKLVIACVFRASVLRDMKSHALIWTDKV